MWCCSFKRMLWTDRLQDFSPWWNTRKKKFLHGLRGEMMAVFDSLPDKALKLHIRNTVRHDWHGRWSYSGGRTWSDRKCEQVKSLQRLTRRIVRRTAEVSPLCSVGSAECSSWMQQRERRDWPGVEVERLNYVSVCGKKQNEGASVGQFAHEQVTNLPVSFCSTFLFSNPTDPHSQDTAVTLCSSLTDTFNN